MEPGVVSPYRGAILAAIGSGVLVGAATVASRYLVEDLGPMQLAMARYGLGALMILPIALKHGLPRFEPRDWPPILLLGIFQFAVLISLLNYSLLYISAALAALIFSTSPMLTLIFAWLMRRESLSTRKITGVALSIAGVGLALTEGLAGSSNDDAQLLAIFAVISSAAIAALCSILYRPYLERYPTNHVSLVAMIASVAILAVGVGAQSELYLPLNLTFVQGASLGFVGFASALGYFFWLHALRYAPASDVTMFLALGPITAAILGALVLQEIPGVLLILGLLITSAGLRLGLTSK